jgi:hypothetical protein
MFGVQIPTLIQISGNSEISTLESVFLMLSKTELYFQSSVQNLFSKNWANFSGLFSKVVVIIQFFNKFDSFLPKRRTIQNPDTF